MNRKVRVGRATCCHLDKTNMDKTTPTRGWLMGSTSAQGDHMRKERDPLGATCPRAKRRANQKIMIKRLRQKYKKNMKDNFFQVKVRVILQDSVRNFRDKGFTAGDEMVHN